MSSGKVIIIIGWSMDGFAPTCRWKRASQGIYLGATTMEVYFPDGREKKKLKVIFQASKKELFLFVFVDISSTPLIKFQN